MDADLGGGHEESTPRFMRFFRMADQKDKGGKSNSMDEDKQREIASKGGQSVPPEKRSFSQDPDLAAEAGRQGGESVPDEKRSFSQNRELASEAGRKGGESSGGDGGSSSGTQRGGSGNFAEDPERRRRPLARAARVPEAAQASRRLAHGEAAAAISQRIPRRRRMLVRKAARANLIP
jgi:general stress protein YciG